MDHKVWHLLVVLAAAAAAEHSLQKRSGMKLCGRMLVEALAAVCQNEYYDPNQIPQRKSHATVGKRNFVLEDSYPSSAWDSAEDGFLDARTALAFLSAGQLPRGVRGVADECCRKSCSYTQLVSYCGPPTSSRK